jgi:hypothetical protein
MPGGAFRQTTANNNILYFGRVDFSALNGMFDDMSGHGCSVCLVQTPTERLPNASTGDRDNDCFSHKVFS